MIRTVEAMIDKTGHVEENPVAEISETAFLSEQALAEDWNRPAEAAAWSHLQPERSS